VFTVGITLGASAMAVAQHELEPETWIEMRKMFREEGPVPTIEEDVAALAGPDARRAGPRLIDRGPEVLPVVHAALLEPDAEPRHALRVLQVMGPISHESSVPVLLDFLRRDADSPLPSRHVSVPQPPAAGNPVRRVASYTWATPSIYTPDPTAI
jgi:hypothetical protein